MNTKHNTRNILLIFQFLISFFLVVIFFILKNNNSFDINTNFLLILTQVIFIYILLTTLLFIKKTSLYSIFIFCYFIFNLGRIFISESNEITSFLSISGTIYFSNEIINESILFNICVISLIHFGFFMSLYIRKKPTYPILPNYALFSYARILFFISFPLCLIKFLFEIKTISEIGYVGYYKYGTDAPFIINVMRFIFEVSFLLILASKPNYYIFKKYTFLFLLTMSLFLIIGVRSKFILYFIFIIWYYYKFYAKKDIGFLKVIAFITILIFSLILVQLNRQNWIFNSDLNYFKYFFISQGVSFYILPLTIHYINEFKDIIPSIFSSFSINSLVYTSQNIERLNNVGFLGDIISYNHLGNYYFDGNGLGGSFIAELYQAGYIITITFSIFLGFFINYFDNSVTKNRYLLAISFYIVSNIAYMPRSVFFKAPYMLLSYFIIFLFLSSLPKIRIFIKKKI